MWASPSSGHGHRDLAWAARMNPRSRLVPEYNSIRHRCVWKASAENSD
jgi:hypothetical protein